MRRLRRLLRVDPTQRTVGREIDDEIRFHIESRVTTLVASGMDIKAAEARAMREFGDVDDARRDLMRVDRRRLKRRWISRTLDAVRVDARQAARGLLRRPSFTLAVLSILALGIGANATMFSLVDRVFVRDPSGVARPRNVHRIYSHGQYKSGGAFVRNVFSVPEVAAVIDGLAPQFDAAGYWRTSETPLAIGGPSRAVMASWITPGYFRVLGVAPALGRVLSTDEGVFGDPRPVAIISWRLWQREFGGSPDIIGRSVRIESRPTTIIGVAPKDFAGVDVSETDVWLPLATMERRMSGGRPWYEERGLRAVRLLVRVTDKTSSTVAVERANASLRNDADRARFRPFKENILLGSIIEARGPHEHPAENTIALLLAGVTLLVLCIACANVGNLLLARAAERSRETGVRVALGISNARLALGLLIESLMLATAAGAVAVVAASWLGTVLRSVLMPDVRWPRETVDGRVLGFSVGLTLVAALVAGVIPWLQIRRADVSTILKSGAGSISRRSRIRTLLLSVQTAFSLVLVVGAGLFIRSLNAVRDIDLGYDTESVITVSTDYLADSAIAVDDVARLAASLPGVDKVARTAVAPLQSLFGARLFTATGDSLTFSESTGYMLVDPGFFATTGLSVVRGRGLTPDDRRGSAPVMVVSEAMARGMWPGQDPIGRCMRVESARSPCYRVVGIVENSHAFEVIEQPRQTFFIAIDQAPAAEKIQALVIRAHGDPAPIVRHLRETLHDTTTGRWPAVATMDDVLAPQYRSWRLGAELLAILGVLALVVAAFGLYSAIAYSVSTRTRELGVRLALGARPRSIVALIVGDGMRRVGLGLAFGFVAVLIAAPLVRGMLYGTAVLDPIAIVGAIVLLSVTAVAAMTIPAWRASRFDPLVVLRSE